MLSSEFLLLSPPHTSWVGHCRPSLFYRSDHTDYRLKLFNIIIATNQLRDQPDAPDATSQSGHGYLREAPPVLVSPHTLPA